MLCMYDVAANNDIENAHIIDLNYKLTKHDGSPSEKEHMMLL